LKIRAGMQAEMFVTVITIIYEILIKSITNFVTATVKDFTKTLDKFSLYRIITI